MERMGNLAFSSSKPHIFQPIHADSSSADQLKVKLNDFKFTDGWPEFYKAHELKSLMMSESEDGNEMDRAESVGTSKGNGESEGKGEIKNKGKGQGQGRKEQTSSDRGNLKIFFFLCVKS
ncbi:hypothetical protein MKX03_027327 [Papaver bracteatum]|nr:hypothetical protein MKX03_027327 [Papaver bracteatum]